MTGAEAARRAWLASLNVGDEAYFYNPGRSCVRVRVVKRQSKAIVTRNACNPIGTALYFTPTRGMLRGGAYYPDPPRLVPIEEGEPYAAQFAERAEKYEASRRRLAELDELRAEARRALADTTAPEHLRRVLEFIRGVAGGDGGQAET